MFPIILPTARLPLSRVHVQLTIPKSSDDFDPFNVITETGNVTLKSPPPFAIGGAFFSCTTFI